MERGFYYRNFQSRFFHLNVELNTKTKKNDEIELFYYFLVYGAVYIYTCRKNFTELHLRKTQMLINIGHKVMCAQMVDFLASDWSSDVMTGSGMGYR